MKYRIIFVMLVISSLLISIEAQENSVDNTEKSILTLAASEQDFTVNFVESLSVFENNLYTALFSGLAVADPQTLDPRVGLAVSWFINHDSTVYTFTLRKRCIVF